MNFSELLTVVFNDDTGIAFLQKNNVINVVKYVKMAI